MRKTHYHMCNIFQILLSKNLINELTAIICGKTKISEFEKYNDLK